MARFIIGLGRVALKEKKYLEAQKDFSCALKLKRDLSEAILSSAIVEFRLKNFERAKRLFHKYQESHPLNPECYYLLGRIYEKRKDYQKAADFYQDALRLGMNNIYIIKRLLRISHYLKRKDLIQFIIRGYNSFKERFKRTERFKKKVKGLERLKKEMAVLEKKIQNQRTEDVTRCTQYVET